ncbi:hypothetical protein [Paenibacillus xylanivorans]|nr:hypothetical protein [Paenibacillus xylanivorans]
MRDVTPMINQQAVIHIVRKKPVWTELAAIPDGIHFYHITDSLGRKWRTIGQHITDAIEVFGFGYREPWTIILEQAPYDSELSVEELLRKLNVTMYDEELICDMHIILNTLDRRNEFVQRILDINPHSIFQLLYELKAEYLVQDSMSEVTFKQKYKLNPVEALTFYFLENVDWYTYRQWIEAGGTAELCIRLRNDNPYISLTEAIERAEQNLCSL